MTVSNMCWCSCNLEGDNNFGHLLVVRAIYNTPQTASSLSFAQKSVSDSIQTAKSCELRQRELRKCKYKRSICTFSTHTLATQILKYSNTLANRFSSKRETAFCLNTPFLPVVSFPGSEPSVLWFYMHPSPIVLPTASFVLSKHRS